MKFNLALDESDNTKEKVLVEQDINILIDKKVEDYVQKDSPINIDYGQTWRGPSFSISTGSSSCC